MLGLLEVMESSTCLCFLHIVIYGHRLYDANRSAAIVRTSSISLNTLMRH